VIRVYRCWLQAAFAAAILFLIVPPNPAAADDYDDCANLDGRAAIDACSRGITSGRYRGRDLAALYYNRGILHDDPQNKLDDYTQAIRIDPEYASAYYNRGLTFRKMNRLDDALADYSAALRIERKHDIYNNRGVAYEKKGEIENAIADYSSAIRLKPDYSMAYYNRGNAYSDQGKSDLALQDYANAIRFNSRYIDAYYNRGLLLRKMGRKEQAIADFREVLKLDPSDKDAIEELRELGAGP